MVLSGDLTHETLTEKESPPSNRGSVIQQREDQGFEAHESQWP